MSGEVPFWKDKRRLGLRLLLDGMSEQTSRHRFPGEPSRISTGNESQIHPVSLRTKLNRAPTRPKQIR